MTNLINLENVSKSYGLKTLLDSASLGINSGDRVGVVGLNGGGKSTLLRILYGSDTPDSGRVSRNNDLRMAMVTQDVLRDVLTDDALADTTVADAVLKPLGMESYEWASNAKIRAVLHGLGVAELGLDTPVRRLSGGERRRTGLAAALVQDLDLLILDEPTNHLDVEGVEWLARHLLSRNSALVVVTHDRWFLDSVATTTWEVHDGQVDVYEGGYNDWTFARAERTRQADAAEQRRQNLARKELAWLRRGAPARTSKPRYRIEAAESLIADVPPTRDAVELQKFSIRRQGKKVIDLVDSTVATPDGRTLVEDLTWRLGPGERIGLVGVNGSGKTTLLRTLAGEYPLVEGRRVEGKTVKLGWLRQELDDLDPSRRLLDAVQDVASYVTIGDKEMSASQLAERLGFSAKRQRTPVGDLSGGERRRLQLTRVLMAEPNVLLLDEPTNDLDIDTLQELESLLDSWPGTMVVISHDRYLIERVCDTTWALFGNAKLTNLPGGIEQYLEKRKQQGAGIFNNKTLGSAAEGEASKKKEETTAPALSAQEDRELSKEMSALERKMDKVNKELDSLQVKMAAVAERMSTDPKAADEMTELDRKITAAREQHEELEMNWLETAEKREG
ncbi:ABC-F family ATP-binding cassette domain-containing protein [Corynebacterium suicordis]|uniref:ABC-F family ATP-binding cassette domain-containing protein n=1 Tax=Corynebacterium suicordis DSM 45110 TaxID=1121369 RepID=A0ABR9ZI84_9CORY|nr:ABC-F family ATP-binding cassette domain-containing protein [Corynebacterium suicordis]MBF4553113.1 ABC-F family ATP-binding cassette domain-containing protein [Corynebacterium suicordis DSM 45110]MDR6277924.1 ATPase subunit of ABC transporter with duplicated ATPase domains [Corynebacterium suicordis]